MNRARPLYHAPHLAAAKLPGPTRAVHQERKSVEPGQAEMKHGTFPRFAYSFSDIHIHADPTAQARSDPLEAEADRMAVSVLADPAPESRSAPPRITSTGVSNAPGEVPASVHRVLQGAGSPLAPALRRDMERRFDFDFSSVRIHTGPAAAQSAREVDADAYTVGNRIVFGTRAVATDVGEGRGLLAHELTHVVQQRSAAPSAMRLQRRQRDPDEAAAITKEETALTALAKRALASPTPEIAVHEVMWRLINAYGLDMHSELSGSRYDKSRKGVFVDFKGTGPRTQGDVVAGDDVLQRVANGDAPAVAKEIEAQLGRLDTARGTIDYVFIMGADKKGTPNPFYTEAKKFFQAEYPGATMVEDVRDLDGINQRINAGGKSVRDLIIVSHAHPDGTLQFSLNPHDPTPGQVDYAELMEANKTGSITQPKPDLVGFWTNVLIRGCNLGRGEAMLDEVRTAFGGSARVIAPTHEQVYTGRTESLGGPFYEEPGESKLSDEDAFKRIKAKPEYAFITDWDAMRHTLKRFPDNSDDVWYDGPFPEHGKEMDLLRFEAKNYHINPRDYTFDSSTIEITADGKNFTNFLFKAKDEFKNGPVTIRQETPPTNSEAEDKSKKRLARPSAYQVKAERQPSGLHLKVVVHVTRTEWELYHAQIHKGGKGFNPRAGTRPWFGDTE
jgi:hypothetical protein